jgi:penicillin-binding protein 1A
VTCGTWIGFDDRQTLGEKETGARAALPMWMDFMRVVIAKKPNEAFATAGAPQKKLDVPLTTRPLPQPVAKPDESDPDAPDSSGDKPKQPAAPAGAGPSSAPEPAPVAAPATDKLVQPAVPAGSLAGSPAPRATAPPKPAPSTPVKGVTAPAKPADDARSGVAKPPPDTD